MIHGIKLIDKLF